MEWTVSSEEAAHYDEATVQQKMEECMESFEAESVREEQEGGGVSSTQLKKKAREELDVVSVIEWRKDASAGANERWFLLVRRPEGGEWRLGRCARRE